MKRNIERIINELQNDARVQEMHKANIAKRKAAREARRAAMLQRMHKVEVIHLPMAWDSVEAAYNEREVKKAAIKQAIWEKFDGSTLRAQLLYLVEVAQGKYNEEFKELLNEACDEIDREKARKVGVETAKRLAAEAKKYYQAAMKEMAA